MVSVSISNTIFVFKYYFMYLNDFLTSMSMHHVWRVLMKAREGIGSAGLYVTKGS